MWISAVLIERLAYLCKGFEQTSVNRRLHKLAPFVRPGTGILSVMAIYHSESLAVDSGH